MITHICSLALVFYPIYEDIRKQQISMLPALGLIGVGLVTEIFAGGGTNGWIFGVIPGTTLFLLGRIFGNCIGDGDCLLITGVGALEGIGFCCRMLMLSGGGILMFSIGMMAAGRLHRKSKVAFVPFLALGYVGAWFL